MQFYITYLKELKDQFYVYLCIVQLVEVDMGFRKYVVMQYFLESVQ